MTSIPLQGSVFSLDERFVPCSNGETCLMEGLPLSGVVMNGDVNCSATPEETGSFSITYRDAEKTLIQVEFESTGMEQTIKEITCI